jgi:hypothetical protein
MVRAREAMISRLTAVLMPISKGDMALLLFMLHSRCSTDLTWQVRPSTQNGLFYGLTRFLSANESIYALVLGYYERMHKVSVMFFTHGKHALWVITRIRAI